MFLQDEEERQLAVSLLASAGEKKTRADRQRERKERKEAGRKGGPVSRGRERGEGWPQGGAGEWGRGGK